MKKGLAQRGEHGLYMRFSGNACAVAGRVDRPEVDGFFALKNRQDVRSGDGLQFGEKEVLTGLGAVRICRVSLSGLAGSGAVCGVSPRLFDIVSEWKRNAGGVIAGGPFGPASGPG